MTKRALIILAHGSRNSRAVDEMLQLSRTIKQNKRLAFDYVETAFLELAEPKLSAVVECLLSQGVQACVVMPYFLSSGNHVERDIPQCMTELRSRYPDCQFNLLDYFGSNERIISWVMKHIEVCTD